MCEMLRGTILLSLCHNVDRVGINCASMLLLTKRYLPVCKGAAELSRAGFGRGEGGGGNDISTLLTIAIGSMSIVRRQLTDPGECDFALLRLIRERRYIGSGGTLPSFPPLRRYYSVGSTFRIVYRYLRYISRRSRML